MSQIKSLPTRRLFYGYCSEGFKHEHFPKIELHRPELAKPLLFPDDRDIIAIAIDSTLHSNISIRDGLSLLDLNQPEEIARFILEKTTKQ